jgi:hypothetical protein
MILSDIKFSIQQGHRIHKLNTFNYILNDAPVHNNNEIPVALFIIDATEIHFIVLITDTNEYLLYGNHNTYQNRRFNGVQPLPPVIPLFTTGIPIYTRAVKYLVAQINPPQDVMPGEDITYQNPLYQNAQHLIQPPHQDHPPLPPYQTQYLIQPRQDPHLPPYQTPPSPPEQLELLNGIINCIFDTYKGILAPGSFRQRFANFGRFYNSEARHEEKDDLGEAETFILDETYKPTIKDQRCNIMGGNIKRRQRRQTNKKRKNKRKHTFKKRRTSFRRK